MPVLFSPNNDNDMDSLDDNDTFFINDHLSTRLLTRAKTLSDHLSFMAYAADLPEEHASEASAILGLLRVGIATAKNQEEGEEIFATIMLVVNTIFGGIKDSYHAA